MEDPTARILSDRAYLELKISGRMRVMQLASTALSGNRLRDEPVRDLFVWEPETAVTSSPLIFLLPAYGARPHAWLDCHPWRPGLVFAYAKAVESGTATPAKLILVDSWTRLGGCQYVNSRAVGFYEDWMLDEVLPLVREHLGNPTALTGLAGKSSGAYGALSLAMTGRGGISGIAAISPDGAFEHSFWPSALAAARELLAFDSDPLQFLQALSKDSSLADRYHATINFLCMCACYSPSEEGGLGFDLPINPRTGERIEAVWNRILAFDPVKRVLLSAKNLRQLKYLHLECGQADEYHLLWAARQLAERFKSLNIDCAYVEHPGGHRGLDGRLIAAISNLAKALQYIA